MQNNELVWQSSADLICKLNRFDKWWLLACRSRSHHERQACTNRVCWKWNHRLRWRIRGNKWVCLCECDQGWLPRGHTLDNVNQCQRWKAALGTGRLTTLAQLLNDEEINQWTMRWLMGAKTVLLPQHYHHYCTTTALSLLLQTVAWRCMKVHAENESERVELIVQWWAAEWEAHREMPSTQCANESIARRPRLDAAVQFSGHLRCN